MRLINWVNLFTIALLAMAFSCGDQPAPALPLSFRFDLLNAAGSPATVFAQGDPITFRFQVINNSDQPVIVYNYYADFCDQNSSFFRVYGQSETGGQLADYGRACFPQECTQIGYIRIAAKDTITTQYDWLSTNPICKAQNAPLPKGHYKTGFQQKFTGNGGAYDGATSNQNFNIEFDVK